MAKRGIASIKGNTAPEVGKDTFYEVDQTYPGTAIADYNQVSWKVYQQKNGQWVELQGTLKKGKKVSFSFPQKWYGKSLLIEAFLNSPEKKAPPGLVIKPVMGPKKIKTLEIRDANDQPIADKPKYGQHITAKVITENMLGDTVELSIWERDTLSSTGHDPVNNQLLWKGNEKITANDGILKKKILLTTGMMQLANKSYFDGGEHEYYLVVKSNQNTTHSNQTVAVKNEIVLSPNAPQTRTAPQKSFQESALEALTQPFKVLTALGWDTTVERMKKLVTVQEGQTEKKECGGTACIKKGEKSEIIREINIRLNGFGGNVPTDEFTDQTEKMVKKFQKDYMKIPETGKICGNTLKAIDDFGLKFPVNFEKMQCPCGVCSGFGQGKFSEEYNDAEIRELRRKYEYPGIHRSLVWALKATMFYLSDTKKDLGLKVGPISSGYRCHENNKQKGRTSTNHMGKALDIHIYKTDDTLSSETNCDNVRDLMVSEMNAQNRWASSDRIALEPSTRIRIGTEFIATTWVHYDVREFSLAYKEDKYFVKSNADASGEKIVDLARTAGLVDLCNCMGEGNNTTSETTAQAQSGRVDPDTLSISQKGIDFIKDWEKFSEQAYDDSEGYCTIGYGHLIDRKRCATITLPEEFKNGITVERATELFNGRLADFEAAVKRDITVDLYQYEYDALVSLLFNTGANFLNVGGARNGETQIKKKINNGEYEAGADEMSDVTNGGVEGLVKRRNAEINMFKNNVYDSTH